MPTASLFYGWSPRLSVSIAILIVPLYDTLRVTVLRLRARKSIFIGDKRHIHHMMLRAGFSHKEATLYISLFNIFIIALAFLLDGLGILLLGLVLLALCLVATQLLTSAVKKRESGEADVVKVPGVTEVHKVG